jgi:mono/diheme cytochrome c family protein
MVKRFGRQFFISWCLASAVVFAGQLATAELEPLKGQAIYKENCLHCHGSDGKGNGVSPVKPPDLSSCMFWKSRNDSTVLRTIHDGSSTGKPMLRWKQVLSEQELNEVYHYVQSLRSQADCRRYSR